MEFFNPLTAGMPQATPTHTPYLFDRLQDQSAEGLNAIKRLLSTTESAGINRVNSRRITMSKESKCSGEHGMASPSVMNGFVPAGRRSSTSGTAVLPSGLAETQEQENLQDQVR